jgi:chemotaxis regulatin CheY-phosphate phosphatase CheZ
LELARKARTAREAAQIPINDLIARSKRPERTLRYVAMMARREAERHLNEVKRLEDFLDQLEKEPKGQSHD